MSDSAVQSDRASDLTGPFWAAAAQQHLVRPVCRQCGHSFFVPRWSCPFCRSEDWEYEQSSGLGVVYSATVVHRGPDDTWPTPYVLAIVDLEEGWQMLSRVLVSPSIMHELATDAGPLIGQPVMVQFSPEDRAPFRTMPVFGVREELA